MMLIQKLLNRFQRLHWRLTLSYTLVTVAALLIVELVLLGGLLLFIRSDFLINQMGAALEGQYAAEARRYLMVEPVDFDGLNNWVQQTFTDREQLQVGTVTTEFDEGQPVYVIDRAGQLLAQNPPPPNFIAGGQQFDFESMPQVAERFDWLQQGERDLAQLRFSMPDGGVVNMLPLVDDDGELLGVLMITLPLPALNAETFGPLLSMIVASILPITIAAGLIGTVFGFITARNLTRRISTVAQAADNWSRGDFSAVVSDSSLDELGQLSRRLNLMAEQLQNLLDTRQELATLEERNRLARELHDAVKQQIFAVSMQVGAAQALLPNKPDEAAQQLAEAATLANQAQQELTTLILALRPAALYNQGLIVAVREFSDNWSRQTGIAVQVMVQGERALTLVIEQALYRVVQEALANVARHSQARQVTIGITYSSSMVQLTMRDDGQGFDLQTEALGVGLQSMQERIAGLGGRLTLTSQPGHGTTIQAGLPLPSTKF